MKNLVKGIHHVALKCSSMEEFEKTKEFYGTILGLSEVRSWGEGTHAGIMFDTGSGFVEIFADGARRLEQGAVRHFALATDDPDACIQAVRDAGYEITVEPNDIVIPSEVAFPVRIAFCIGPVGEEIEFFLEK